MLLVVSVRSRMEKKIYTNRPLCGHCCVLDSHHTPECVLEPYCFYWRVGYPQYSRQCKKYRLEQNILQLANFQFIILCSARKELFREEDGGTKTYASPFHFSSSTSTIGDTVVTPRLSQPLLFPPVLVKMPLIQLLSATSSLFWISQISPLYLQPSLPLFLQQSPPLHLHLRHRLLVQGFIL